MALKSLAKVTRRIDALPLARLRIVLCHAERCGVACFIVERASRRGQLMTRMREPGIDNEGAYDIRASFPSRLVTCMARSGSTEGSRRTASAKRSPDVHDVLQRMTDLLSPIASDHYPRVARIAC